MAEGTTGGQRGAVGARLTTMREQRMWTQGRLAQEAGVSPTTVSGIESGRISRPHFGTLRKLADALGVDPGELVSRPSPREGSVASPLSLDWAMSSGADEFERGLEGATMEGLSSLSRELDEEEGRLRRMYGEARGSEQRRLIKTMIRQVAANSGSVEASITAHEDNRSDESLESRLPRETPPDQREQPQA